MEKVGENLQRKTTSRGTVTKGHPKPKKNGGPKKGPGQTPSSGKTEKKGDPKPSPRKLQGAKKEGGEKKKNIHFQCLFAKGFSDGM